MQRPIDLEWENQTLRRFRHCCANCGGSDHVAAKFIVPLEVGGQMTESNTTALCRACDMAAEWTRLPEDKAGRRCVTVWLSESMYRLIQNRIELGDARFSSMSSLVRFLIDRFVESPDRFDDLELYQDEGSDVKVNLWISVSMFEAFRATMLELGMTITDGIKALVKMYEVETLAWGN